MLVPEFDRGEKINLFHANQAAVQINPNEIFVFGGISSGLQGSTDSFIIGPQESVDLRFAIQVPEDATP